MSRSSELHGSPDSTQMLWSVLPHTHKSFKKKSLIFRILIFFFFTDPHLEKMQMFPIWPMPPCVHWQMLSNVSAYFQPLLRCTDECHICSSLVSSVFLSHAIVASKPFHSCCQPMDLALEWFLSLFIFVSVLNSYRSWAFISTSRNR